MVQLLVNNQLFEPPQGLVIDELNPYSITTRNKSLSLADTVSGQPYTVRVTVNYYDQTLTHTYQYIYGQITQINVTLGTDTNPNSFTYGATTTRIQIYELRGLWVDQVSRPVGFTSWSYSIEPIGGSTSQVEYVLKIFYTDGTHTQMIFDVSPLVEILGDCNCVCPSTLQLADRAISILGSF